MEINPELESKILQLLDKASDLKQVISVSVFSIEQEVCTFFTNTEPNILLPYLKDNIERVIENEDFVSHRVLSPLT